MRLRQLGAALAAAALLIGLTGCQSGAAAFTVDGRSVGVDKVQRLADGCKLVVPEGQPAGSFFAHQLLLGAAFEAAARNMGISITDQERESLRAQVDQQILSVDACGAIVDAAMNIQLAGTKIGQERLATAFDGIDISLNPRYGQLDHETLALSGTGSLGQLS